MIYVSRFLGQKNRSKEDGLLKASHGLTSTEEVLRVLGAEVA